MKKAILPVLILFMGISACKKGDTGSYPIEPVPFTEVSIRDNFWSERIKTNRELTIPYAFHKCEETGRIDNFKVAGGIIEGTFNTRRGFDDSDVFKVMEGAAYSLIDHPDKELEEYLDSLIYYVGKAQEDDGYLYTVRTILGDSIDPGARYYNDVNKPRWLGVEQGSHELYNIGHMYEAAVAHYQATGKRNFLDIAIKSADLVCEDFGWGKLELFPGHQEIEIGLVKLYNATGEKKYLDMAKFFLDVRGKTETQWTYNQSHKPVTEQDEAVGHAVRALYMFTGMADIAAITGNQDYLDAMDRLWHNIVDYQLYITGGVGAPGGNEGFAGRYNLSNHNAYCETCAAIANVFWNYRMFLTYGNSKYMDVVERSMYNNVLSGVSMEGNRFFYPNRLESRGGVERSEWFNVSCCPTNISRFIPSVPGYIYAKGENEIFVNLMISSETVINLNDNNVNIVQESGFPWKGDVRLSLEPEKASDFGLRIRIPGWAVDAPVPSDLYSFNKSTTGNITVELNGEAVEYDIDNGYILIDRNWKNASTVNVNFPFEVREIIAHDSVEADRGKIALQAGPIVYCAEWPDQENEKVLNLVLDTSEDLQIENGSPIMGVERSIKGKAHSLKLNEDNTISRTGVDFTAIPYYAWAHRGPGEMAVWIAVDEDAAVNKYFKGYINEYSRLSGLDDYRPGITGTAADSVLKIIDNRW